MREAFSVSVSHGINDEIRASSQILVWRQFHCASRKNYVRFDFWKITSCGRGSSAHREDGMQRGSWDEPRVPAHVSTMKFCCIATISASEFCPGLGSGPFGTNLRATTVRKFKRNALSREIRYRRDRCFCDRLHADARGSLSMRVLPLADVYRATGSISTNCSTHIDPRRTWFLLARRPPLHEICGNGKTILSKRVQIYA